MTVDDTVILLRVEIPAEKVGQLEASFDDTSLSIELDRIHGLDVSSTGNRKRDVSGK